MSNPYTSYGSVGQNDGKKKKPTRSNPYTSYGFKSPDELYNVQKLKNEKDKQQQETNDQKSNLGKVVDAGVGIGDSVLNFPGAAARFSKDVLVSMKDTVVGTYQDAGDIARGTLAENEMKRKTEERKTLSKEWSAYMRTLGEGDFKKPDVQKKLKEFSNRNKSIEVSQQSKEDLKTEQELNRVESGARAAELFMLFGTMGLSSIPKAILKQGGKIALKKAVGRMIQTGGTDIVESLIRKYGREAAIEVSKEIAKRATRETGVQLVKRVAYNATREGILASGFGATQTAQNNPDASVADIAKGAATFGAMGATFGAGGTLIGAGAKKIFSKRAARTLAELKNSLKELEALNATPEQKLLKAGPIGNKSTARVPGKPGTPSVVKVTDAQWTKEFNKLSRSYDKAVREAEKVKSPIKQKRLLDIAEETHVKKLEKLNNDYTNGRVNPKAKPPTPGKTVETGFVIQDTSENISKTKAKNLRGPRREAHLRVGQINKIISEAQVNGTNRSTDELRALMRERRALIDALDGNGNFDDIYKDISITSPEKTVGRSSPDDVVKAVADESIDIKTNGVRAKIRSIFSPVKNFSARTQASFERNASGRAIAKLKGRTVRRMLKKAAKESDYEVTFDTALQIEKGTAPKNTFTAMFREIADKAREEARKAGLDIGYIEDYVPHIWKQSVGEVERIARSAGMKSRAEGRRLILTYEEGIKLKLKPKYKNPVDMMEDYVKNIQTTQTNTALITDLADQGLLKANYKQPGWVRVTAEGFPRTSRGGQMSAPREIAKTLDNIYGAQKGAGDKVFKFTAKVNSVWQDVALAGGIPYTPANFFTAAQSLKVISTGIGEVSTLRPIRGIKTIVSPVEAFFKSFSKESTSKLHAANSGLVEALAKRGVLIIDSDRGGKWSKLFNEPTFGRFMPNLELISAKNIQSAFEKKIGREAALDLTAKTMKQLFGITDEIALGRSQGVQDIMGTMLFARQYRESIINVIGHTLNAVVNPKTYADKSYSLNRRLAVGLGATYMIYDQLNRKLMGNSIGANPEGKELALGVPYGEKDEKGNQKVVYLPFMPSFMTLPRAGYYAARAAARGDVSGVGEEAGKLMSMPIKTISEIVNNRDYFGRNISDPESSDATQLKDKGLYLLGQGSPAAVRAGLDFLNEKPPEQIGAQFLELPVRFGKLSPLSTGDKSFSPGQITEDFFDAYKPAKFKRDRAFKEVKALRSEGKKNEARRKAEEYNNSLNGLFSDYYKKYGQNPDERDLWNDMLKGLFIRQP